MVKKYGNQVFGKLGSDERLFEEKKINLHYKKEIGFTLSIEGIIKES